MKKALSLFLLFLSFTLTGQQCQAYLQKICLKPEANDFKQFIISRAALLEVNKPSLCSVVLPPNKDYMIQFCTEPNYKPLKIRLIDKERNKIIYDNSKDAFNETLNFSVKDNPITLLIEVTVNNHNEKVSTDEEEQACTGFWIYFKKPS